MSKINAFVNGMMEFRLTYTTYYSDDALNGVYDMGREIAHKLTLRYFEPH